MNNLPGVFDLRDGSTFAPLREISGGENQVATVCWLEFTDNLLRLEVEADDPDMLNLISSVSAPNSDGFLYEEDCLQIAIAFPGAAEAAEFCVVNPHGSRKATAGALEWQIEMSRSGGGWRASIALPVPTGLESVGLSLHRFYRGIRNEVHGLAANLPHPLAPTDFAALVIGSEGEAATIAAVYRHSTLAAAERRTTAQVDIFSERIQAAREADGAGATLAMAEELARARSCVPVSPVDSFLCWNEGHFLNGVLDLWELTGNREWLEVAIPRMKEVLAARGSVSGVADSLWGRPLPTWYNARETGTACTLVTGVIILPITRLLRLVFEDANLNDIWERVRHWVPIVEETLAVHDNEWVEFGDGSGMHLEPYVKGPRRVYPNGGSRINPMNREFLYSIPLIHMARVIGNPEYLRKATLAAQFFKNQCDVTAYDCLSWEYEIGRYIGEGEDIDHAACQVQFAQLCYQEGIVFDAADMQRIANTMERGIFRYGEVPCGMLRGYRPGLHIGAAAWGDLCRHRPELLPKIEAVIATALHENDKHFTAAQGWGLRILTGVELARRRVAAF